MNPQLEEARNWLLHHADLSKDGKLSRADVDVALSKVSTRTQANPLGAISITAAIVFIFTAVGVKLFFC